MKKAKQRRKLSADTVWRRAVGAVSVVLILWGILPWLINRIVNAGVIASVVAGVAGLIYARWRPWLCEKCAKGWKRVVMAVIGVSVAALAVLFVVLSACMITAAAKKPPEENATVVVLGALIRGEEPSLMLRLRLDAAMEYLEAHPEAACVVSGGQGADEPYSEAHVMQKYLTEHGVDAARIYAEDQSSNTFENIRNSLALIRQEGLSENLVIATQEFHEYRAASMAKRAGVSAVGAATAPTPLHLLLCYWVRECAAICRLWLLGY